MNENLIEAVKQAQERNAHRDLPIYRRLDYDFKLDERNNKNVANVLDIAWYSTKSGKEIYCDSKQFLYQNIYKHTFLLAKRGIGKTYSIYKMVLDTALEFLEKDLASALEADRRDDVELPINVIFILQNALFTTNLVKTFNDLMSGYDFDGDVNIKVVSYNSQSLALEVSVDIHSTRPFIKFYTFGECLFLTMPNLARGRQFNTNSFVVFDEVEKAFVTSLLDDNRNSIDKDKLFNNFLDIINSLQRNKDLRFIYTCNISNLDSQLWDFLKIATFDFEYQVNDFENSKVLILNLIPLFTNQSMANYFQDLTTLGISEEELFKMEGIINEENVIKDLTSDSFVLFDDNYIYYFNGDICNIEKVDMNSMQKLNDVINKEFKTTTKVCKSDYELMDEWLIAHNYDHNQFTESLVPLQDLLEEQVIEHSAKIPVYSIGKISLDNTIVVDDVHSLLRGFKKSRYKFKSHREYFIYAKLI